MAQKSTYRKVNMLTELRRMRRGQKTQMDPRDIADWALQWVKIGLAQTEIERLERMFRLKDPRK